MNNSRHHIPWRVALQIASMLSIVIGINYFSFRHYFHIDCSRSHRFSLSSQGSILFTGIKQPAHIIIYFSPSSLTEGAELYGDLEALMKEYKIKARENLIIEYLDPVRQLGRAREVQAKYQFNPNENVIVIDYLDHNRVIPVKELGDYDRSGVASGKPPRLVAFRGEQVINAALIGLSGVPLKKVYFLQGHGEGIPGQPPLEIIGRYLQHQNLTVELLNLAATNDMPMDAALLVIAGAHSDLSPIEVSAIKNYWTHSGRLLVLLDPTRNTPLLDQLLIEAGITPRLDRVLKMISPENPVTFLDDVTGKFIPGSELTKQFLGLNITLLGATESLNLSSSPNDREMQIRPLIEAVSGFKSYSHDDNSALTSDFSATNTATNLNNYFQTASPIVVSAMADHGALHDDRVTVNASRMIVVGNSDFINDKSIDETDLDFFSSALNELIDRIQLTGNTAKMKAYFTLNLSEEKMNRIALWCILVIPGLAALLGMIMIWRRRKN